MANGPRVGRTPEVAVAGDLEREPATGGAFSVVPSHLEVCGLRPVMRRLPPSVVELRLDLGGKKLPLRVVEEVGEQVPKGRLGQGRDACWTDKGMAVRTGISA